MESCQYVTTRTFIQPNHAKVVSSNPVPRHSLILLKGPTLHLDVFLDLHFSEDPESFILIVDGAIASFWDSGDTGTGIMCRDLDEAVDWAGLVKKDGQNARRLGESKQSEGNNTRRFGESKQREGQDMDRARGHTRVQDFERRGVS